MGQYVRRERRCGGGHVRVHAHEAQQHGGDVGACGRRAGWLLLLLLLLGRRGGVGVGRPGGRGDASLYERADLVGDGPHVQAEQAGVALRQGVVDVMDLARQLDGELGLELGDEVGENGRAEGFKVAEGEQHAEVLSRVSLLAW